VWVWKSTQYNAESAATPSEQERYTLLFTDKGKFTINAPCGRWTGKYNFGGRSLDMEMNRNWFSGCRGDNVLKIFLDDVERSRAAFIEDGSLQITLAGSEGIMYFKSQ
jgi:hypothetical protein